MHNEPTRRGTITWGAGPSEYIVKNAAGFSATLIDQGKDDPLVLATFTSDWQ